MAYIDLSASFVYKTLLTYQLMDGLGENDKWFNNYLTAVVDLPNSLSFANTFGIAAKSTGAVSKNLVKLDGSDIVQLGVAGTEVRLPADPTNVLGAATKQYVDGVQMFQTQPVVTGGGATGSYATILSLSATTRGHIRAIWGSQGSAGQTITVRITIDGGTPVVITSTAAAANNYRGLQANLKWSTVDQADAGNLVGFLLDIAFNTSVLVEATAAVNAASVSVLYDKIP